MADPTEIQLTEAQQERLRALYHAYQQDRAFVAHKQELDAKRNTSLPEIRAAVQDFISSKSTVDDFISASQKFSSHYDYWGFRGMAGQMQFNIMLNTAAQHPEAHQQLEDILRATVSLPTSADDAVVRINRLTDFLVALYEQYKPKGASVRNVPYVPSYFWEAQNRDEFPIYYPNEAVVYQQRLSLTDFAGSTGQRYATYQRIVAAMRQLLNAGTWEVEHFGYWLAQQAFIGFSPEVFARLARNAELNAAFVGGQGYATSEQEQEAEDNAKYALARLKELVPALRPEISFESYELEMTIKPSEPRATHGEPQRWRQEAWLSVWQPQKLSRVAAAANPQLQVRLAGDGLYAGYYSGQSATFAPTSQWQDGPVRDALLVALAQPDVAVYALRRGENPQPLDPTSAADLDPDASFFVGQRWATDEPIVGLPAMVGQLVAALRRLYPLYQVALTAQARALAPPAAPEVEQAEADLQPFYAETTVNEPTADYIVAEAVSVAATEQVVEAYVAPDFHDLIAAVNQTLAIDEDTVRAVITHLWAGRHVLLYGPPGVGKTRLATILAATICGADNYSISTANPEWSAYEVVGGLRPRAANSGLAYEYAPGVVSQAAERCWTSLRRNGRPHYLIIDEFNRANLDRAFGELFTALEYPDALLLSRARGANVDLTVPPPFRIIGTLNSDDRNTLYDIGFALRRRFALVEIGTPPLAQERAKLPVAVQAALRRRAADVELALDDSGNFADLELQEGLDALFAFVTVVRAARPIGTALLIDALAFVATAHLSGAYDDPLAALQDAIIATILPQLERNSAAINATIDRAAEYDLPTVRAALERMQAADTAAMI